MAALSDEKTPNATFEDLPTGTHDHARDDLERRLLRKLDLRMSIIVVIYTLNYVSLSYVPACTLGCTNHTHMI
jgi:hypothetical protein